MAIVAYATLAVAGTALAASGGWQSLIGSQATDGPPKLSDSPVPRALRETLGVLRRPQDARDHSAPVRAVLGEISSYHVNGVRPDSFRFLHEGIGHQAAILFSAEESDDGFGHGPLACLSEPVSVDGSAEQCWSIAYVRRGVAISSYGGPDRTMVSGLMPDDVAAVVVRYSHGIPCHAKDAHCHKVRVRVSNNYFEASGGRWEEEVATQIIWKDGHRSSPYP